MKTRIIGFLVLILMGMVNYSIVYAQFNHVGIRAGMNLSNAVLTNSDFAKQNGDATYKILPGFTMGLLSQASGNGYLSSSIGIFYTNTGFKDKIFDVIDFKLSMHSVKVPLEFRARIPIAGPVILQAGMGPYVSFAFAGSMTDLDTLLQPYTNRDILSIRSLHEAGTFSDGELKQYNRFDGGIIFGGEVEVQLPNQAFILVGFNYEFGVTSISNEWEQINFNNPDDESTWVNPGIKNRVMSITVSYMFDVTDKKKNKVKKN